MQIKCRDTGEIVHSYADYLKTGHWRNVREIAFIKSNGLCICCKQQLSNNFVAHHRTYSRIGKERMRTTPYSNNIIARVFQKMFRDDVIAVCRHCHNGESKNHIKLHEFVRVPRWARNEKDDNSYKNPG